MARGLQNGYSAGLTQSAGTGPVTPIAMPGQENGATGVDQLVQTMFPINQPITSPMAGGPQTIDMKPPITSPMQGPTFLGDPSPGKLNFGKPVASPKPLRPVRPFGGGIGGQNPFFK